MIRHGAKRPWTPDEDARLRALRAAGAFTLLAAAKLKRTMGAIKERTRRLKASADRAFLTFDWRLR
jgi:hypothetical protein